MKKKIIGILIALLVLIPIVTACSPGDSIPGDIYTQNIYPGTTHTYSVGSIAYPYSAGYFDNLYMAGVLVTDNVTGAGTTGNLVKWLSPSTIGNATNTDVQVAGMVASSHTQNTDIILTTNGVIALINAGVLVNDLHTDRWLFDDRNTFLGVDVAGNDNLAHTALSEGWYNTAIGNDVLYEITTGYSNTAVGANAGDSITSGYYNTAIGHDALVAVTTGNFNTALGYQAIANGTGGKNTGIGSGALASASGDYNTSVGVQSLNDNTGDYNTAIGVWAGENNIGDNNVFIGYRAGQNSGVESDKLYIDNSNIATPLIYGDFATNKVIINDDLDVADDIAVLGSVQSNLIPTDNSTYDIGSATFLWDDIYVENLHAGTVGGLSPLQITDTLDMSNHPIKNVGDPTDAQDVVTKNYSDTHYLSDASSIKLDDLATPDDNTDLDVSATAHGLMPKLPSAKGTTRYFDETGQWTLPSSGSGDMTKVVYDTDADNIIDKSENVDDGIGNYSTAAQVKSAILDSHTHSNKSILDAMQESFTTALKNSYDWLVNNITSVWKTSVDNHIANTSNPHSTTATQVGLGNVSNVDTTNAANISSGLFDGDRLPAMSTTKKGGVPATGTPSGKYLKDDGTWATVSTGGSVDPVTTIDKSDEFLFGSLEAGEVGELLWSFTTTAPTYQASVANHPGIRRINTSATSANVNAFWPSAAATNDLIQYNEQWDFTFIVRIPTITTVSVFCGAMDGMVTAVGNQDRYGFEFNPATNAYWRMVTGNGSASTSTNTDITIVANTWYKLRVVRTSTGVDYYINGVLKGTIITTLPDTALSYGFHVQTLTAAARNLDCDFFRMILTGVIR